MGPGGIFWVKLDAAACLRWTLPQVKWKLKLSHLYAIVYISVPTEYHCHKLNRKYWIKPGNARVTQACKLIWWPSQWVLTISPRSSTKIDKIILLKITGTFHSLLVKEIEKAKFLALGLFSLWLVSLLQIPGNHQLCNLRLSKKRKRFTQIFWWPFYLIDSRWK